MAKYAISTLGCKVNGYEANSVSESFKSHGYEEVDFKEFSDIYVVFTCTVTNTASSKSRQKIHQAKAVNPNAIIVVVGCYVQVAYDKLKEEGISILVGSSHKGDIVSYVEQYQNEHQPIMIVEDVRNKDVHFENLAMTTFEHQTRAYLKIQDGCNQFCSYCIIPYARGKERSLHPDKVVETAKQLSLHHHEIVLAGIHTGRYGREYGVDLAEIIKRILAACPNLERIRISSIEITEITDSLLSLMEKDARVARHLHIPLQAGSNETLRRMNRPYSTEDYYDAIASIRKRIPSISISTDLIVGFPQETEEEFEQTKVFLKKCEFSFIHTFPFASKEGTKAHDMKPQVEDKIKKHRAKECAMISKEGYAIYKKEWIGKTLKVLIETNDGNESFGHSSEYLPVYVKGKYPHNTMVEVVVTSFDEELYAEGI